MLSRLLDETESGAEPLCWPAVRSSRPSVRDIPKAEPTPRAIDAGELERIARDAYEAGRRQGEADARAAAEQDVRESVRRFAEAAADAAATRDDVIRRAEADVVRLSIEIARRILHRELSVDSSALEALIRAALEKLRAQEIHRVKVHPAHDQLVRACMQQLRPDGSVEVVSDPSQPAGGAVFEIARGSLDASVETQLAEIERGLIDQLRERS